MRTWLVVTGTPATLREVLEELPDDVQATVIAGQFSDEHPPDAQLVAVLTEQGLSTRDAQIVAYSFAGHGRRRIEGRLGLSSRALRRAWRRIMHILDVPDRAALHNVVAVLIAQARS